jgi:hypothetical protein
VHLLLVHHTGHHFDVLLAARESLKARHRVDVWSNTLGRFGRRELVRRAGITLYDPAADYDGLVLITGDGDPAPGLPEAAIRDLLERRPVVRLMHRFRGVRDPGTLHLFGRAPLAFVPVRLGVPAGPADGHARRGLLVQGNLEARRDYAVLPRLAAAFPGLSINVVGRSTPEEPAGLAAVTLHRDLDEIAFHAACAANRFIAPLVDPRDFARYFSEIFTTSVMIAFAHRLPVIAHAALFDIYPLRGLMYRDEGGLFRCVETACAIGDAAMAALSAEVGAAADRLHALNQEHFDVALAEAGARA